MKLKLSNIVITLGMALLVSACGGLPLAQPEGNVEQAAVTAVMTPTGEADIEPATNSPLPTPTAMVITPTSIVETPPALSSPTAILIVTATPTAIGPAVTPVTGTPTPVPMATVLSDEPLLSPEVLARLGVQENQPVWVEAWPSEDKVVLQVGYYPNDRHWAVTTAGKWPLSANDAVQVQALAGPAAEDRNQDSAIAELQSFHKAIDYAIVSPDGKWAAWAAWEILLVKRLGTDEPPVNLLGVAYERYQDGAGTLVWSPDSRWIAYVVENDNAGRYEIRISDPLGQQVKVVPLWDTRVYHLAWSSDEQYLAFITQEQPQSENRNIYLVQQDEGHPIQVSLHNRAEGPLNWSPVDNAITYRKDVIDSVGPWLITIDLQ